MKIEGSFILRYRVFDIFSKKYNDNELVIQAECYGGPFRVYSTKEFPGLHASTDLTKVRLLSLSSLTAFRYFSHASYVSNLIHFIHLFIPL